MYIIENGKGGYITNVNNSYTMTGNIKNAKIFQTEVKAKNVLNSLPKTVRRDDFFTREVAPSLVQCKKVKPDSAEMTHIKSILSELDEATKGLEERKEGLRRRLSVLDQELSDIDHYIEFYPLSAYDGYKMAKLRKERLEERRQVKDEITEINLLRNMKTGETLGGLKGIKNQKYTPRFMCDIFEEKEKRRTN